jgi:hypothetical protein
MAAAERIARPAPPNIPRKSFTPARQVVEKKHPEIATIYRQGVEIIK